MEAVYLWSAVIEGTLFLGQFALSLIGSGDTDVDTPDIDLDAPDVDSGGGREFDTPDVNTTAEDLWFVGMFSLRAM